MKRLYLTLFSIFLFACSGQNDGSDAKNKEDNSTKNENEKTLPPWKEDFYPSTYKAENHAPFIVKDANIYDALGNYYEEYDLLVMDNKIEKIGKDLDDQMDDVNIIDAAGKFLTPGLIDIHSHLGVYPSPSTASTSDGNEATAPNRSDVSALHSINPKDANFIRLQKGGITTLQIMPGSANLFGGRTLIVKNVSSRSVQGMKFPNSKYGLKMACGENPKRVYGNKGGPSTRMGNFSGYRNGWINAKEYLDKWKKYLSSDDKEKEAPKRDLLNETLAGVLDGDIFVNMHCYKGDEMINVMDMMDEFSYKVTTFHHAIEAYKISDLLAKRGICVAIWPEWWGFKLEAYDTTPQNAAIVEKDGACVVMHSDSPYTSQYLLHEVAKSIGFGKKIGIDIDKKEAIKWVTINAAKALYIDQYTGSLEKGKMADLVIWDRDPFSVYSKAEQVFIDGNKVYDLHDENYQRISDLELGQK